jgi:hypothetical protein
MNPNYGDLNLSKMRAEEPVVLVGRQTALIAGHSPQLAEGARGFVTGHDLESCRKVVFLLILLAGFSPREPVFSRALQPLGSIISRVPIDVDQVHGFKFMKIEWARQ